MMQLKVPAQAAGAERRSGERRGCVARRSGEDRREMARALFTDFRTGTDRRIGERRTCADRRRCPADTPATYSRTEAALIRALAYDPESCLACPRCSGALRIGPAAPRNGGTIRELCCPSCRRCLMVKDMPERGVSVATSVATN